MDGLIVQQRSAICDPLPGVVYGAVDTVFQRLDNEGGREQTLFLKLLHLVAEEAISCIARYSCLL